MKISIEMMKKLKYIKNSFYEDLKIEYLSCSNRLAGSTFSEEQLELLITKRIVSGRHFLKDVYETKNSIDVFELIISSLGQDLNKEILMNWLRIIKRGCFDSEISEKAGDLIDVLLYDWEKSSKDINDIVRFHMNFEQICRKNRISHLIILKQCIEHGVDIPMITEELEKAYKNSFSVALRYGDYFPIAEVFIKGQRKFNDRFSEYYSLMDQLK